MSPDHHRSGQIEQGRRHRLACRRFRGIASPERRLVVFEACEVASGSVADFRRWGGWGWVPLFGVSIGKCPRRARSPPPPKHRELVKANARDQTYSHKGFSVPSS